ncbi:MAG: putative ABC transporter ATP-binding protein YadG [Chlamydiia bacterium]|nr:putative ABC transporter ATP-binding protein YadG [Chlamydiia bacterium]
MENNDAPLLLENIHKHYGKNQVLMGVDLALKKGEIFGMMGKNGAGKSTLISIINSLVAPSRGRVLVFGHDMAKSPKQVKQLMGTVPQELVNYNFLTPDRLFKSTSLQFGMTKNRDWIEYLIDALGLEKYRHTHIRALSGGFKKRVSIARALLHHPKLLLLDEPSAGVDIELKDVIRAFVKKLSHEGITILLTTHYLEEAEEVCDRFAFLGEGKIQMVGDKTDVLQMAKKEVVIHLKTPLPALSHPLLVEQNDQSLTFICERDTSAFELYTSKGIPPEHILDISVNQGTLEQVFKKVLK